MKDETLVNCLGLKPDVLRTLLSPEASGADLEIHFGGEDGRIVGFIQDWKKNVTVLATPPVFKTGEEAVNYLRALRDLIRQNSKTIKLDD